MSARPFAGLQFVLVGRFSVYQYVVEDLIREYGGEVVSFATKNTNVAIVGAEPSPTKYQWVRRYKLDEWSEDMLEMKIRAAMAGVQRLAKNMERALESNEDYGTW